MTKLTTLVGVFLAEMRGCRGGHTEGRSPGSDPPVGFVLRVGGEVG
jgi:hypothetical protein